MTRDAGRGVGRVPDDRHRCRTGAGWVLDPAPVSDRPAPVLDANWCWMDIFAYNFLHNCPILINFFLFESP